MKIAQLMHLRGAADFLKEVLSDKGLGSYSRFTSFMIVSFTLAWVTFLVVRNHALPDLTGPTWFIGGAAGNYGVGQLKEVAAAMRGTKDAMADMSEGAANG